jgi:hypothetical protein
MKNNKDINLVNYVNFEMDEINNLSTDLYESMMDRENAEVVTITESIIKRLRAIQQSHK